jgi:ketosteroid isomerase-like protein
MTTKIIIQLIAASALIALAAAQTTPPAQPARPPRASAPATKEQSPRTSEGTSTAQAPQPGTASSAKEGTRSRAAANAPGVSGVRAAFEALLDGIRRADVDAVTSVYWRSPQLIIFNNNGTVTKTWDQLRANRASSYPNIKDVSLEVRDVHIQMLGRDGAVVMCLWKQSQTVRGTPETATGRLTVVFRRIGGAWKAIHTHTSPDAPDPSRLPASERTQAPAQPAKP